MTESDKKLAQRSRIPNLERKVDDLALRYMAIREPTPILREIMRIPEQYSLLLYSVARQVALIKCRSSAFEDGQVNIYDKALLWLTGLGSNPTSLGALELYMTEFLGIVPISTVAEGRSFVERHISLGESICPGRGITFSFKLFFSLFLFSFEVTWSIMVSKTPGLLQDRNPGQLSKQ